MMAAAPKRFFKHAAFTLLEVLVTCAILGLLLAILLSILNASLILWRDTDSKIYADREARAARLLLSQDLSNVVLPANSSHELWPRVTTAGDITYLQFLTKSSSDYQDSDEGNQGDICFVEYAISPTTTELTRRFVGSAETLSGIIRTGNFPAPGGGAQEETQMLASNMLPENTYAVRGFENLEDAISNRRFILLNGADLLPNPPVDQNNPPRSIEINFAITDPDSTTPEIFQLLENDSAFVLKNSGLYSFRIFLPPPLQWIPSQ
jgi:prepilin-type N-terminal cleavage/methylation domain-containing protein